MGVVSNLGGVFLRFGVDGSCELVKDKGLHFWDKAFVTVLDDKFADGGKHLDAGSKGLEVVANAFDC